MRRQISTVSLCLRISPVLLKVLLWTGNWKWSISRQVLLLFEYKNSIFCDVLSLCWLKEQKLWMSLQIQAERLTRTIVLILTYVNFTLSPFDWRKKFAYRNKIYLNLNFSDLFWICKCCRWVSCFYFLFNIYNSKNITEYSHLKYLVILEE